MLFLRQLFISLSFPLVFVSLKLLGFFPLTVKPNLQVFRARFSEITLHAVRTACENLTQPDQKTSDAVDVRQELDLRIGT